jgi:putative redox protein
VDLITVSRRSGSEFDVRVRGHVVRTSLAGGEAGITPAELLAGSLGACIAMLLQDRCDRQGHVDGEVGVSLAMELADGPRRIASIFADVDLPADVPEDEKERIRQLAGRCVVHETLARPPRIDVEVS